MKILSQLGSIIKLRLFYTKMINKLVIPLIFWVVFFSLIVHASFIAPQWYWNTQKIQMTNEEVVVSKDSVNVKFRASILVDESAYNYTKWVTFQFSPVFNNRYESVDNYTVSLKYNDGSKTPYREEFDKNYTRYEYNVSLKPQRSYNEIIFEADYTLRGIVGKLRGTQYLLFYVSEADSNNRDINFLFPYNYEVIKSPNGLESRSWNNNELWTVSNELTKKPLYFVFNDLEEEQRIATENKRNEQIFNVKIALISALFGVVITMVLTPLIEKYFRKDKEFFGSAKIKKYNKHDSIRIKLLKK